MEKFYSFQWAQKKGEILLESLHEYDDQALMRGDLVLQEPLSVKVSEGKKFYDIAHLQDPFNFTISERVYNLLKNTELKGWSIYEIDIRGRWEKYYGFQVLGRCGTLKRPVEPGFVTGYEFEHKIWDGSDFFSPKETLLIFCTEKVKEFFEKNKITNIALEDISTVEWYSA